MLYTDFGRANTKKAYLYPTPIFAAAVAQANAGTYAGGPIVCVGDSTTAGQDGSAVANTQVPNSYPMKLAGKMTKFTASADAKMGDGNLGSYSTVDSRVTITGTTALNASLGLGGKVLQLSTPSAQFSFQTTGAAYDTIDVYTINNGGSGGTFTVNNGGATLSTIDTTVNSLVTKTTISKASGTEVVNCVWVSGTPLIFGVVCRKSLTTIPILNCGRGSATAASETGGNAFTPLNQLAALAPVLTILKIGVNDWRNSLMSGFRAAVEAMVTTAQATGDVIICTPTPANDALSLDSDKQRWFVSELYAVAEKYHLTVVDHFAYWGGWYQGPNATFVNTDKLHMTALGYDDNARQVAETINRLLTLPVADFNFVADTYSIAGAPTSGFAAAVSAGKASFGRASTKFYTDSTGALTSVSSGSLARGDIGALIEPSRSNNILQSQFASGWSGLAGDGTIGVNAATAPDGTSTAAQLTTVAGTNSRAIYQLSSVSTTSVDTSIYVKPGTVGWFAIAIDDRGTTDGCFFNVSTGALGTAAAGVTGTITAATNGWYRCSILKTGLANSTHYVTLEIHTADAQGISWTASGSETILVWGADQDSNSGALTSYIPTTSATATRAADAMVILVPNGTYTATVTFDDNSTQTLTSQVVTGGTGWTVPTNLTRPNVKRIVVT